MIDGAARDAAGRRSTCHFPEIEKFDRLPEPRADGRHRLRLDHGRLQQVLHVLRRALHARRGNEPSVRAGRRRGRIAGRAGRARDHAARPERQRLPRPDGRRHDLRPRDADAAHRAHRRHRAHPLHDLAPGRIHRRAGRGLCRGAEARELPAPAGAERLRPHPRADEARLHAARVQAEDPAAARRAPRHQPLVGLHRRLSRRDRGRFRADDGADRRGRLRPVLQLHLQPAARHARRRAAGRSAA